MKAALVMVVMASACGGGGASSAPSSTAPTSTVPSTADDPIARLVAYLDSTGGLWVNGVMPNILLPAMATPADIVQRALQGYDGLTSHHIVEVRHIDFDSSDIRDSAALVDTNLGQRIVLFGFDERFGWATKVFGTDGY